MGRRILDLASGSGLCGIAAMQAGASAVTAVDIDPFAAASIELNARANGRRVTVIRRDVLDEEPPDIDLILAGDCWYEADLAERVLPWLRRAQARGIDVVTGDPGRRYLPTEALVELATYEVRTTTELEDLDRKHGRVFALRPAAEPPTCPCPTRRLGSPPHHDDPIPAPSTSPDASPEIRLTALTKRFQDVVAVDAISLTIETGEFFSLLGPSGCGKTTTLRMIGGFEQPTSGTIELRGHRRDRRSARQAPGQHGLPELRALPPPGRRREHRLRPPASQGRAV